MYVWEEEENISYIECKWLIVKKKLQGKSGWQDVDKGVRNKKEKERNGKNQELRIYGKKRTFVKSKTLIFMFVDHN